MSLKVLGHGGIELADFSFPGYALSWPFIALLTIITAVYMDRQDARGAFIVSANSVGVMEGT